MGSFSCGEETPCGFDTLAALLRRASLANVAVTFVHIDLLFKFTWTNSFEPSFGIKTVQPANSSVL